MAKKQEVVKMQKGQGYLMLGMLFVGLVLLWISIASWLYLILGLALMAGVYALYARHVKKGGITVQEAWRKNG